MRVLTLPGGSPPRAWGQPAVGSLPWSYGRFTPTGVGTTSADRSKARLEAVHPHGRGDNVAVPFVRDVLTWFTPTGVGTTGCPLARTIRKPVHPHGRGDNHSKPLLSRVHPGSPPRAWGQPPAPATGEVGMRFTPTGVGTTGGASRSGSGHTVHPHGRGDNT